MQHGTEKSAFTGLFYRPEGAFLGDVVPYCEDGKYYIFYLRDPRDTGIPVDHISWGLLVTEDFVTFEDFGVVLPAGDISEHDNCIYTGSVFREAPGKYHIFYTANNNQSPAFRIDGKPVQTVMHAVSTDLVHWTKDRSFSFGSDGKRYEIWDWRDPFVYRDEENGLYRMLLCARLAGKSPRRGGIVLSCSSKDLRTWEIGEPFYAPDRYSAHECPDLFRMGDWWYLVYSTFSDRCATHYRISAGPEGPWRAMQPDTFDARAFYAAKTAGEGDRRFAFGWLPTRHEGNGFAPFDWGGNLVVHELKQGPDGTLFPVIPDAVLRYFGRETDLLPQGTGEDGLLLSAREGYAGVPIAKLADECLLTCCLQPAPGTQSYGLFLQEGEDPDSGFFFRVDPFHRRLVLDRFPRNERGSAEPPFLAEFERPLDLPEGEPVVFRLVKKEDCAVLYVSDRAALSVRLCPLPKGPLQVFAEDGEVRILSCSAGVPCREG